MNIFRNIWRIICYPLLYLAMQAVVVFIYMIGYSIVLGIRIGLESAASGIMPTEEDILDTVFSGIDISIPVILSVCASFLVIFMILKKEWRLENFWSLDRVKAFPGFILLSAGFGVVLNFFTVCVLTLMPLKEDQLLDLMLGNNFVLEFLGLALLGPFIEEVIFRGIVFRRLAKIMRFEYALILQAVIFGVIHLNLVQGAYAFFLGIIIGIVYFWFGSIWYAVAVHAAYNAASVIMMYIAGDNEIKSIYLILVAAASFAACSLIMIILNEKRKEIEAKAKSIFNYNNIE